MSKLETILVAIDHSAPSRRALEEAVALARRDGAELHIAHAIELPAVATAYAFEVPATYMSSSREDGQRMLDEAVEHAAEHGVRAKSHLSCAPAPVAIDTLAEEVGADLLIVGTHGHTGLKHFALGSVAERALRHAPCSVLVVKERTQDDPALRAN